MYRFVASNKQTNVRTEQNRAEQKRREQKRDVRHRRSCSTVLSFFLIYRLRLCSALLCCALAKNNVPGGSTAADAAAECVHKISKNACETLFRSFHFIEILVLLRSACALNSAVHFTIDLQCSSAKANTVQCSTVQAGSDCARAVAVIVQTTNGLRRKLKSHCVVVLYTVQLCSYFTLRAHFARDTSAHCFELLTRHGAIGIQIVIRFGKT